MGMFHFRTNHNKPRTAGRLRVVPPFSFAWRKRRGEDFERREEDGEDGSGTLERESERRERDFERMERTDTGL